MTNAGCFSLFLGEKLNPILLTITFIAVETRNIGKSKVSQCKDFHRSKYSTDMLTTTFGELIYSVENSIRKKARTFNDGNYRLVYAFDSEEIDEINQS